MELKWESGKLCRLTQCSFFFFFFFLLKSLILLLEQLNVSVDFVAVLEVLVGHCVCFKRPRENPSESFKIMCWVSILEFQLNFVFENTI